MLAWLLSACTATSAPGETAEAVLTTTLLPEDADTITWTPILTADDRLSDPRDLGFDPEGRLWVANRKDDRTFIVLDPGTDAQVVDRRKDGYAEHFMEEVAALAFEGEAGAGDYGNEFGSCGDSRNTYNNTYPPNEFMGPTLWSTDLDIFGVLDPMGLGSHLDMQHESPLCVGIEWERDNVYWVFDGYHDAIVRYDFAEDHDVGQDDHSDGIVYRFAEPVVARVDDAPGHLALDRSTGMLYIADTGNGRILRLDTASGSRGEDLRGEMEEIELYAEWVDATWTEVVTGLDRPGGLLLADDHLVVGEWGTGLLHEYTLAGELLRTVDTGVGPEALHGIERGPDGRLWLAEVATPAVLRMDVP